MEKPKNTSEMLALIGLLIQEFNLENYKKIVEFGLDKYPMCDLEILPWEDVAGFQEDYFRRRRHLAGEIMDLFMEEGDSDGERKKEDNNAG